ncbi:MAG: 50S ribosomal protein L15 [Candidatus Omnitrophica bacterium]|nr:50S ribosomal protein L15 [Candidatus Omnitrophota bacterium]
MQIHSLPKIKKKSKRLGRGPGSGRGKTSGRGHKGVKARSGRLFFIGFAGGNLPYFRRIPKRGFTHLKRRKERWQIVNLKDINEKFNANEEVNPDTLFSKRLIKERSGLVKILGKGNIEKALSFSVHRVSEKAKEKIEKAKGKIECLIP